MSKQPTLHVWREVADQLRCDIPTIKAVFEVEAAGAFFDKNGKIIRRFEPHHFPREHWGRLGFAPGNVPAWRASLKVKTSRRRQMFATAESINSENAYRASSWGAPQIMGFNHRLSGYSSATAMVNAFEESADNQIRGFVAFVINAGLDGHLRSQDWHSFAAGYNGNGQAAVYAGRIESAYRRQSGGNASATVLRVGSSGEAVRDLQTSLNDVGILVTVDGVFGQGTDAAVRAYQQRKGIKVDGIAGATTQRMLDQDGATGVHPPREELTPTAEENKIDAILNRAPAIVGSGGVAGLLGTLNENSQTLVVGGVVLAALVLVVLYVLRKKT